MESSSEVQITNSSEIERLLNPAYCAFLLARYIFSYRSSNTNTLREGIVYPLIFLCLPLALHSQTLQAINKHGRTYGLHRFIRENPTLLVKFAERVEGFTSTTREALIFGIKYNFLQLDIQKATIISEDKFARRITSSSLGNEIIQPVHAADLIGYWFSRSSVAEIFLHLGIQPQGVGK